MSIRSETWRCWGRSIGILLGTILWSATAEAKTRLNVDIQGLEGDLLANAHAFLDIFQRRNDPDLTDLWIRHMHKQAADEIKQSLMAFGYYNVDVEKELIQEDSGAWKARYLVARGVQVTITEVDIRWTGAGAQEPALLLAAEEFPLKPGDGLLHSQYDAGRTALLERATLLGYPDVHPTTAQLRVYPRENTARIILHLETGERYYLGEVRLHQDVLRPDFVRRFVVHALAGEVYSSEALLEIQQDLIRSGFFSLVDVRPQFGEAEHQRVPVDVYLRPATRQSFTLGLGYASDIMFHAVLRWAHRRLNSRGHRADAFLNLSIEESTLRGNYWIPIGDPRTDKFGVSLGLETENSDNVERMTFLSETAYYSVWQGWQWKAFLENRFEQFTAGNEREEEVNILSQGLRLQRRAFEEGVYPRRGWELWAQVRGSPGWVAGNEYAQVHFESSVFLPLLQRGRLFLRGEAGATGTGDFLEFPSSLRFYAGGDQSVRGYAWKSLGPTDESGEVVGGEHIVTATAEYNVRVVGNWVGAAFYDAGNAFNEMLDTLFTGAGGGARYLAPFGAVQFDLAWPLDREDADPEWSDVRVHIGFEVVF